MINSRPLPSVALFLLQHRSHMFEACGIQLRTAAGQFGDELVAVAGECNENEIGIQHRDQRSDNAAADLAHVIILPCQPEALRARRDRGCNVATRSEFAGGSVHGIACALSYVRGGPDEFDTCLLWLATPNWLPPHGAGCFAVKQGSRQLPTLSAQFEGEPCDVVSISGMSCFSSAPGFGLLAWECRHGPAQPKLEGRSLEKFRSGSRRFRRRPLRSFQFLQGPGIGPAFSASMMRCPGRHRLKRPFRPRWGWPVHAVATEA